MVRRLPRWTKAMYPEIRDTIVPRYLDGFTLNEVAEITGYNRDLVSAVLSNEGIPIRSAHRYGALNKWRRVIAAAETRKALAEQVVERDFIYGPVVIQDA